MAKRSVRRQRRAGVQRAAAPPRASAASGEPSRRPWRASTFWLGGAVVGMTVAVIALAAFLVLGGDDDESGASASPSAVINGQETTVEELEQKFAARDKEQVETLTRQARDIAAGLQPVMTGLERALPRSGEGRPASPQEVDEWLATVRDHAAPFQESISGDTGHNVARHAVRAALDGLMNAIETYRIALRQGGDRALERQAAAQRDNAVRTWSAAAIQIDAINIDAGFGHQHIGQLSARAAPPDTLPQGTDARPEK